MTENCAGVGIKGEGGRTHDGNDSARKLFLRNGFIPTGRREPLESNPAVGTEWLVFPLDQ